MLLPLQKKVTDDIDDDDSGNDDDTDDDENSDRDDCNDNHHFSRYSIPQHRYHHDSRLGVCS